MRSHLLISSICFLCLTLLGCVSVKDLSPGMGSSVCIRERTYNEIWEASIHAVAKHVEIKEVDKAAGLIHAESQAGLFSGVQVVSAFIKPPDTAASIYTVEVISRSVRAWTLLGTDWEPLILQDIQKITASASLKIRRYAWQLITSADSLNDIFFEDVDEQSLTVVCEGQYLCIPIDSIIRIRQVKPTKFWTGASIGLIVGFTTGTIIAVQKLPDLFDSDGYGLGFFNPFADIFGGAAAGFLLGGAIGAAVSSDVVYEFTPLDAAQKLTTLQTILTEKWVPD